jgi:hypothetical protein
MSSSGQPTKPTLIDLPMPTKPYQEPSPSAGQREAEALLRRDNSHAFLGKGARVANGPADRR